MLRCCCLQGKSLKQELQRQQKVLAAARESETALQKQLADKNAALQAAEDRHAQRAVSAPSFKTIFWVRKPIYGEAS